MTLEQLTPDNITEYRYRDPVFLDEIYSVKHSKNMPNRFVLYLFSPTRGDGPMLVDCPYGLLIGYIKHFNFIIEE